MDSQSTLIKDYRYLFVGLVRRGEIKAKFSAKPMIGITLWDKVDRTISGRIDFLTFEYRCDEKYAGAFSVAMFAFGTSNK